MDLSADHYQPVSTTSFLPATGELRRLPLAPGRARPLAFFDSFEDRALVYDCFRHGDDSSIIVVGPPALNLENQWRSSRWHAGETSLRATFFPSRSTQLIALEGAPKDATEITLDFAGSRFVLAIQPNEGSSFKARNVLVTMNKDNDLEWIGAWARWHAEMHGADACIFFDNGSTRYGPGDVVEKLLRAGILYPRVLTWPHRYGRKDPAVLDRPHYPHFLQVSSLVVALRRFAMQADGLLNCDIDELVSTQEGNIFQAARKSPNGIVTLKGNWIETAGAETPVNGIEHLAYRYTHRLPLLSRCANKWAVDPSRDWLRDLTAKPSVHRFYDVPKTTWADAPVRRFWHFKAINTGWKEQRREHNPVTLALTRLKALDADAQSYRARRLAAGGRPEAE